MHIAVVEGHQNLLPREEYEIKRDIRNRPWQCGRMPSFLGEFDAWFAVTAYNHTGDERYLKEAFSGCS